MTSLYQDSIFGQPLSLVLNAPYQTVAGATRWRRNALARRFCREHGGRFGHIRGNQIWTSPYRGILLSALIDDHIGGWDIQQREGLLCCPLDHGVYTIRIGPFGATLPGSESILSPEEARAEASPSSIEVLDGGLLAAEFPQEKKEFPAQMLPRYRCRPLLLELTRAGWFGLPQAVAAAAAFAVAGSAGLWLAQWSAQEQSSSVEEMVEKILTPVGIDLAADQMSILDSFLQRELDYFLGKGLTRLRFSTDDGLSLNGDFPETSRLAGLIEDCERAGLELRLADDGWSLRLMPTIARRAAFPLPTFNRTWLAVQQMAQHHGYDAAMEVPERSGDRKTVAVQLSGKPGLLPPLSAMARQLEGEAAVLLSLDIEFDGHVPGQTSIQLALAGT